MTKPVHTVSYMKTAYRKYQIITLVCALLTIGATLLAAVSGIQISDLRKQEIKAAEAVPAPPPVQADFALERELARGEGFTGRYAKTIVHRKRKCATAGAKNSRTGKSAAGKRGHTGSAGGKKAVRHIARGDDIKKHGCSALGCTRCACSVTACVGHQGTCGKAPAPSCGRRSSDNAKNDRPGKCGNKSCSLATGRN